MNILHLTLKKHWFDLIASGQKTEEYREIKPYWTSRLMTDATHFKHYDAVRFRNGYQRDAPEILVKCKRITIGWSPVYEQETYIILLGRVLV